MTAKKPKKRGIFHDALPGAGTEVDYWRKLSAAEKDWLYRFNRETLEGRMKHPLRAGGKKRVGNGQIHRRVADRTKIYSERWARYNDVVTRGIRAGEHEIPDLGEYNAEDSMIDALEGAKYRGYVPDSYYATLQDGTFTALRTDSAGGVTVDHESPREGDGFTMRLSRIEYEKLLLKLKDQND